MPIEFTLNRRQQEIREAVRGLARMIVRPESLKWDKDKAIPDDFLKRLVQLSSGMGGSVTLGPSAAVAESEGKAPDPAERKKRQPAVTTTIALEELAWGDAALLLCFPGPGLGGPPVRASGTPQQRERFFSIFKDMSKEL